MKRYARLLSALLAVVMVVCLLPAAALAANEAEIEETLGFNDGTFANDGSYPWFVTQDGEGVACVRSGNAGVNSSSSVLRLTVTLQDPALLRFDYLVSSESSYDKGSVSVNGVPELGGVSGVNNDWETFECELLAGENVIEWRFTKDGSMASGSDGMFIRNLSFASVPLRIVEEPEDLVRPVGDVAVFRVKANYTDASYQWYYKATENDPWSPVAGASGTTANYRLTVAERHDCFQFKCVVTRDGETVETEPVRLWLGLLIHADDEESNRYQSACPGDEVALAPADTLASTQVWPPG